MSVFRYEIENESNLVRIFQNEAIAITQPFDPETYQRFLSVEEATKWAEAFISERESWYEEPSDQQPITFGIEE